VPEHNGDKAVVFEEFFTTGLRMPPHPVLVDILLKFHVHIH
jgi:tRNA A37 threonylcarbamoyladenosine synthetase subunit TsaC/SUA5/YrdC